MRLVLILAILCGAFYFVGCTAKGPKSAWDTSARSWLQSVAQGHPNVEYVRSLKSLPVQVQESLEPISDAGGPFYAGCDVSRGPHRRFLMGTKAGRTYNVAIEQGGLGYFWFAVRFVVDEKGNVLEEEKIEPDSAANRSQPIRSQTNSTSSAAGSAR